MCKGRTYVQGMKRTALSLASMAFCATTGLTLPAAGQVMHTADSVVSVTWLDGWRQEDGTHYAGIQIDLAPGWKTYWRAPGDGGIPTTANWERSENLAVAEVLWPRPEVFRTYGMRSVGYADRVVLPVHLEAEGNGAINIELDLRLGVCNEICMPVEVSLSGQVQPDEVVGRVPIQAALTNRPQPMDAKMDCTLVPLEGEYRLDIATNIPALEGNAETSVVELGDGMVWVSEPDFMRDDNWVMSSVRLIRQNEDAQIDLSTLRLTMLTTTSAIELTGCD